MITLNVNMFVEPDVPVVPLYILDYQSYNDTVPSAVLQLNTTPRSSVTANSNLAAPYYFNNGTVTGSNNYIFIPDGKAIDLGNVYVWNENGNIWSPLATTADWFHPLSTKATDDNGNLYNVYRFYYYNEIDEIYESTVAHYSFNLI